MEDLLRKLAELKAQQGQSLPDEGEIEPLAEEQELPEPTEQESEEQIQNPEAPEDVRLAAIKRVREKYLGK